MTTASGLRKAGLHGELVARLQADLDALERAQREAQAGATHEEAKAESDKDTRAVEQTYLARGQAARVEALRAALATVQAMPLREFAPGEPAAIGAVVTLDDDGEERRFFIAPESGGSRLAGGRVQVVTPKSPLGEVLVGARAGESCSLLVAGKLRELDVVAVE